jgi:hypothetical protein
VVHSNRLACVFREIAFSSEACPRT